MLNRNLTPDHLFSIPELDFSNEIFADPLNDTWFRIGLWSREQTPNPDRVESVVARQSLLLPVGSFAAIFDRLGPIGNTLSSLGQPTLSESYDGVNTTHEYNAYHSFHVPFAAVSAEPLVFFQPNTDPPALFVNPDLWLYLGLEERPADSRTWWDRRRVQEVLRRIELRDDVIAFEIRTEYLLRYLQARQMALLVGHYRHLHLFNPTAEERELFVREDLTLGTPELGVKAIFNNWGMRDDIPVGDPFLQRRLHLWFQIKPPPRDLTNLWSEPATFDTSSFTLPTRVGAVAPARFREPRVGAEATFAGIATDFMSRVYFRQEVLSRYETMSGFSVDDNGSVHCDHYWSLARSTSRLGNELLSTAIGDFAEGVPYDEWLHWQRYAVEAPSQAMLESISTERPIPEAVNGVVTGLEILNGAFTAFADHLGAHVTQSVWNGSLNSLAGRQLKWVYPDSAASDEFLKRATLLSTLVIDALHPRALRQVLSGIDPTLCNNDDTSPRPLSSRNLLQRVTLAAAILEQLNPDRALLAEMVRHAEGRGSAADADLQDELSALNQQIRREFAALAFLYDLRTYGGLAHAPNEERAAEAAGSLGLPSGHWHRRDFIRLLELVASAVVRLTRHLERRDNSARI